MLVDDNELKCGKMRHTHTILIANSDSNNTDTLNRTAQTDTLNVKIMNSSITAMSNYESIARHDDGSKNNDNSITYSTQRSIMSNTYNPYGEMPQKIRPPKDKSGTSCRNDRHLYAEVRNTTNAIDNTHITTISSSIINILCTIKVTPNNKHCNMMSIQPHGRNNVTHYKVVDTPNHIFTKASSNPTDQKITDCIIQRTTTSNHVSNHYTHSVLNGEHSKLNISRYS